MGLCTSKRDITSCDISSFEDSEESTIDKSVTDELNVGESLVVAGRGKRYQGTFGISQLNFTSDDAIKLTKPLFGARCATLYKSQATFFQKAPTFYSIPLTEVTPQLFFGSFEDANNEQKLKDLGITHIISLIGPKNEIKGIKHKHKPMNDYGRTDLKGVIALIWPFVLESQWDGNKLFVHCQSGQNRSATVVLLILLKLKNEKLDVLHRMVKKKRPMVQINETYARQLSEIESELFGETSVPKNWMRISSYDMESGVVEFNDSFPLDSSTMETVASMSDSVNEIKILETPEVLSPVALNPSALSNFEWSEKEDSSSNTSASVKFCILVD